MDMSKIPTADLEYLASGDMSKVSTATLEMLSGGEQKQPAQPPADTSGRVDGVPKWGRKYPNAYAGAMTALDVAPALASFAKSSGVGIPVAGAINAAAKAGQRAIGGEEQTGGAVLEDFLKGMAVEGGGRAIGKGLQAITNIPGIREAGNKAANWLTRSAGKFGTGGGLKPSEQKAMAETVLKKGYLFNDPSYDAMMNEIGQNKQSVDAILKAATQRGDLIQAREPMGVSSLGDLLERGHNVRGVDPGYTGEVIRTISDFEKGGPYSPTALSVSKRQLDQNTLNARINRQINDASEASQKALANGIREVLHTKYKATKPFDLSSSELLDLEPFFARAINRISQRDIVGLGEKTALANLKSGKLEDVSPGTIAKVIAFVWDRPEVKSRVAKMIYDKSTGQSLPISQWKKGLKHIGELASSAPVRGAFDAAILSSDPLGLRQ